MVNKSGANALIKYSIIATASIMAATPVIAAEPVTGRWVTADKDAIVEIAPCGKSLCGKIVKYLVKPANNPQLDDNNPKPQLRKRLLTRVNLLSGFRDGGKKWKGKIYDPKTGKTYKSILTRTNPRNLKVQGCILFICQTQNWTKSR